MDSCLFFFLLVFRIFVCLFLFLLFLKICSCGQDFWELEYSPAKFPSCLIFNLNSVGESGTKEQDPSSPSEQNIYINNSLASSKNAQNLPRPISMSRVSHQFCLVFSRLIDCVPEGPSVSCKQLRQHLWNMPHIPLAPLRYPMRSFCSWLLQNSIVLICLCCSLLQFSRSSGERKRIEL